MGNSNSTTNKTINNGPFDAQHYFLFRLNRISRNIRNGVGNILNQKLLIQCLFSLDAAVIDLIRRGATNLNQCLRICSIHDQYLDTIKILVAHGANKFNESLLRATTEYVENKFPSNIIRFLIQQGANNFDECIGRMRPNDIPKFITIMYEEGHRVSDQVLPLIKQTNEYLYEEIINVHTQLNTKNLLNDILNDILNTETIQNYDVHINGIICAYIPHNVPDLSKRKPKTWKERVKRAFM